MDPDTIIVASLRPSSPPPSRLDIDSSTRDQPTAQGVLQNITKLLSRPSEPPAKKPRHMNNYPAFTPPETNEDDLDDDLEGFGISDRMIKTLLSKKTLPWDPAAPAHAAVAKSAAVAREKIERAKKNAANGVRRENYEPLFLRDGTGWALFDPNKSLPSTLGELPGVFNQFVSFSPGNTRILEYNIHSRSIRLRTTPELLRKAHKGVEYTKTGPKIVGFEAEAESSTPPPTTTEARRGRGRPRKHPVSSERPSNGIAVGRAKAVTRKAKAKPKVVEPQPESDSGESDLTEFESEEEEDTVVVNVKGEEQEVTDGMDESGLD